MSLKLSTEFRNLLLDVSGGKSFGNLMGGGILQLYTGSQPATADAAHAGTLLATIYPMGGSGPTAPATVTLTTAADTVNWTSHGLSNNQPVIFTGGTLPVEVVSGTIYYVIGAAASTFQISATVNGAAITFTGDSSPTVTCTPVGLVFNPTASSGTLGKHSSHSWAGVGAAAGTIGSARFTYFTTSLSATLTDAPLASGATSAKFDMSVGTSGADLNISSLTVAVGAVVSIDTFEYTVATN